MHPVLLIDENPAFLGAVADAMQQTHRDITLTTAATAEHGLRLLGRRRFDVVISDFQMPGLNGIDLLEECAVACPDTPVLVLTGHRSTAFEQDALQHGAYAVLQKPVDSDTIYTAVTHAMLRGRTVHQGMPPAFTPPDMHLRELVNHRERLSARLRQLTQRRDEALGEHTSSPKPTPRPRS